jgi:FtsP/CotA-like multicopper oxidase with cupredoxin domain
LTRLTRRSFLAGGAGLAAASTLSWRSQASALATPLTEVRLVTGAASQKLNGAEYPATNIWCYGGRVPGPEIRVPQGGRLRVVAENRLDVETTVHWHGVRLPNAMDGVPHLTQRPVAPGETFIYEFDCPDAGTFWYHPHFRSFEQVGRGLYGPLIVEEPEERAPLQADRELTWVLDDWRLTEDGLISEDFGNLHDIAHAGRIGNTATLNGGSPEEIPVRSGERIRLRLVNAANARIFGLKFEGHAPLLVAVDGQPVTPHPPEGGQVVLAPAMRVDLVVDMSGQPGERFRVIDDYYPQMAYRLTDLAYSSEPPLRNAPLQPPAMLAANPIPEPDLTSAERHEIVLGGGMMGSMRSAMMGGRDVDIRAMMQDGIAWAINGVAATGHMLDPMLTLERDRTYVLAMVNETAWPHPMHLHGHSFRVVARNGAPTRLAEWQDTVLIPPRESADVAFVADNPGDWMFHCHILEHQAGGMMGVVRVA